MECLHPHCPVAPKMQRRKILSWVDSVSDERMSIPSTQIEALAKALQPFGPRFGRKIRKPRSRPAHFRRLLYWCPCLYSQIDVPVSARGIVHLCEVTLGERIRSDNVYDAFMIQHPDNLRYRNKPLGEVGGTAGGGAIMEALCAEVLANHGIPHAEEQDDGFPDWTAPCHIDLNEGPLQHLKLYGDFLIPTAPHNLFVSVKSESAKERLILSGNRLETVGFGFFKNPSEFTSKRRRALFPRWGFMAIYMPESTLEEVRSRINGRMPVNRNGTQLYRPLRKFGRDMLKVAGRDTLSL